MGYILTINEFNEIIKKLKKDNKVFAPKIFLGEGTFSDTDLVRYGEIEELKDIEFNKKSSFLYKEVIMPMNQTLFYFTEDKCIEPKEDEKGIIVFLRSCDMHSVKRIDEIYLNNGLVDPYYKKLRDKTKFILIGCEKSFDNCFCVSMGTNISKNYDGYINVLNDEIEFDIKDEFFEEYFKNVEKKKEDINIKFAKENEVKVNIPENLDISVMDSSLWKEYSSRCIACGRCNFVCPTCTCFTMQDIFYKDNSKAGERKRVWASCQVKGYTDMAGGHSFREDKGQRMRFKVMHKVYDYKKRFGYHMCVGCGRCDDICPEYISFSNCVNKLEKAMDEVKKND
ncbi:anaerobic sulfite reductase subunit AsrA [Clostridium fallax]|uniref:Anaerobic sulfite reductase subunit A n=1 Tax=Clostridium fallax TaxID=1533 RepID=A0A1M4VXU3_9CLOT|nr:anaerobic sulfite reductase subunit AsrA [Clostridium fallax]SHE73788.1 anaerobic sulfite reductase subunit A [Clostridium fallax]SQB07748.1 anaerobic sulfite reductase subunit A [Clostridium fallax]